MKISFCCQSCQARLKVDATFAGRAIRCPRCGNPTQIPENASADVVSTENENAESKLAEICAFFEPNPFAFSFALDAETAAAPNAASQNVDSRPNSDESENSADQREPQTFYREEFMRNRRKNAEIESPVEKNASKSPSVNEMIADLLAENKQ